MPAPSLAPIVNPALVVDADHPWLGLSSFTEETQRFFFGRDAEIAEIYVRVREQALTILYGQSGLGKTSLLGAGLVPKLRVEQYRPVLLRLRHEPQDPPLAQQVLAALAEHGITTGDIPPAVTLWEFLHDLELRPVDLATRPPVLILDQFEEIFTLGARPERQAEARAFFNQLADVVENRAPAFLLERFKGDRKLARAYDQAPAPLRIVLTLREDFLSHLEQWKKILPSLMRNRMALSLLNGSQALDAVIRPGNLEGRALVDAAVGARIVCFVARKSPDTPLEEIGAVPPLLSLVCDELNHLRLRDGLPSITTELVETQSADILHTFYEQSFEGQPAALRHFVEDRLITEGGHRSPYAREDALSTLRRAGVSHPDTSLDSLVTRRLISPEERSGIQWLELTHDVLAPLVVKSRDERHERERIAEAERREREARHARNRLRKLLAAFAALTLLAVTGAIFGYLKTREAERAAGEAKSAEGRAKAANQEAQTSRDKAEDQLRVASRKAHGQAIDAFEVRNDSRAGLAYLSEALHYDPENRFAREDAANRLVQMPVLEPWSTAQVLRHSNQIKEICFSPDGSRVVTASDDGTARIWNAATGEPVGEPLHHEDIVKTAVFSPDGSRILTASDDHTARLWDATTGKPVGQPLRHKDAVKSACFSPDGRRILTACDDGNAWLWNEARSSSPVPLPHQKPVRKADFSPDGTRICTITADGVSAFLWDAKNSQLISQSIRHQQEVFSFAFSPDSRWLLTTGDDGAAKIWHTDTGRESDKTIADESSHTAEYSPDGTFIITGTHGGAKRWNAADLTQVGAVMRHEGNILRASFSKDGKRIVTASAESTAMVWDALTGVPVGFPLRHRSKVTDAEFSPDGRMLVTSSDDGTARLWDASLGVPLGQPCGLALPLPLRHGASINVALYSPVGSCLAVACDDGTVHLWNPATGHALVPPLHHKEPVVDAAFTPDGKQIATACLDNHVAIWDVAKGTLHTGRLPHGGPARSVAFSADGKRIVTASDDCHVRIWDASTGQLLGTPMLHEGAVTSAAFNADGLRVVTSSRDKTARIWDAVSGNLITSTPEHPNPVLDAEFSPDGKQMVTCCEEGKNLMLRLWDAETGSLIGNPMPHVGTISLDLFSKSSPTFVTTEGHGKIWHTKSGLILHELPEYAVGAGAATFSRDGKRLAMTNLGYEAGFTRVWDVNGLQPVGPVFTHGPEVKCLTFSPDGLQLALVDDNNTVLIWQLIREWNGEEPADFLSAFAGSSIANNGQVANIPHEQPQRSRDAMRNRLRRGSLHPVTQWFFADPRTRTISPTATVTVPEYITREIAWLATAEYNRDVSSTLKTLVQFDSGHPLLPLVHALSEVDTDYQKHLLKAMRVRGLQIGDDPSLHLLAAGLLMKMNEPAWAEELVQKALVADPGNTGALRLKIQLLQGTERYKEMLDAFEALLKQPGIEASEFHTALHTAILQKELPTFNRWLEIAAAKFPDEISLQCEKAWTLVTSGRVTEAGSIFKRCLSLSSTSPADLPPVLAGLALTCWLDETGGREGEAIQYYKALIEKAPVWSSNLSQSLGLLAEPNLQLMEPLRRATLTWHPELKPSTCHIMYPQPEGGWRLWIPSSDGTWSENYPNGQADRFVPLSIILVEGKPAWLLAKEGSEDFQIGIHLSSVANPLLHFRYSPADKWRYLGAVIDGVPQGYMPRGNSQE